MLRNWISLLYEADELAIGGATGGTPGGGVEDEAAGASAPAGGQASATEGAGEPSAETPPAASSWALDRAEWERTQHLLGRLAERLYDEDADGDDDDGGVGGAPPLDPFSDTFGTDLVGVMREIVQDAVGQATAPFVQRDEHERRQEADQRARDILHDYGQRNGVEFDGSIAKELSRLFLPEAATRWGGYNPQAAQEALEKAADMLIENDKRVAERAVNQFKAQMETVAGAAREPGVAGAGIVRTPDARDELDLARRIAARM